MNVLERLLHEDFEEWDQLIEYYQRENKKLLVPAENTPETLHEFNRNIDKLFTEAYYDFARARRNKDAIDRFIEMVLKDYYKGPNPDARRAAGIQLAQNYPVDGFEEDRVNLFELQDRFSYYYYQLESTVKILDRKAQSKITSNSILNIERTLV